MPSQTPLEMPEILDKVALYLEDPDLARCLRVSKGWRDVFLPRLWRCIHNEFDWKEDLGNYIGALYNHRHFVQQLIMRRYRYWWQLWDHPNLRKLEISCYDDNQPDAYNKRLVIDWNLTNMYPLLNNLSLDCVLMGPSSCQALSEHPCIRKLSLSRAEIKSNAAQDLLEVCKNLESLSLKNVRFEDKVIPIPKDMVFERMRKLSLVEKELTIPHALDMVFHCPILESYTWNFFTFSVRVLISHPVQKNRRPQLGNMSNPAFPQDIECASFLEEIGNCFGNIAELGQRSGTFGPQSYRVLRCHFSTLVKLDFGDRTNVASSTIRDVLCSCPKLELLRARAVMARDIAEGGPWVCRQLRELSMCFRFGETEQNLQPLVFERLSSLVRLSTLELWNFINSGCNDVVLDFRLDCGLGQLAGLQEMKILRLCHALDADGMQRLGVKDVEWMVNNWKKLRTIRGWHNDDPEAETHIKSVLKSHGISR
ncbi:hypothetical protein BGX34_010570 [Mortierella sp. NVP85]|nr:hypothetical protein BGX34_010570 [Mortierella sp. NVP85]